MNKIHYAGKIQYEHGSRLGGWAACCSGDRAVAIAENRQNTYNKKEVTCKACLAMIKKQELYASIKRTGCKNLCLTNLL